MKGTAEMQFTEKDRHRPEKEELQTPINHRETLGIRHHPLAPTLEQDATREQETLHPPPATAGLGLPTVHRNTEKASAGKPASCRSTRATAQPPAPLPASPSLPPRS